MKRREVRVFDMTFRRSAVGKHVSLHAKRSDAFEISFSSNAPPQPSFTPAANEKIVRALSLTRIFDALPVSHSDCGGFDAESEFHE